jgi:hypothetical protein
MNFDPFPLLEEIDHIYPDRGQRMWHFAVYSAGMAWYWEVSDSSPYQPHPHDMGPFPSSSQALQGAHEWIESQ